jgi:hypothetical protein
MSDQSSAPLSSVSLAKDTPWWVLPGLALVILLIFAGALGAACKLGNDTLLTQMFTATVSLVMMAVGYFFGSSAGSAAKDHTIISAVQQQQGSSK